MRVSMHPKSIAHTLVLVLACGASGSADVSTLDPRPKPSHAARNDVPQGSVVHEARPETGPPPLEPRSLEPETRHAAAPRIVAFGDVHGDIDAARRVLRLAGAIDEADRWIGGALVVVQTGDQLDRGDDEREILALFSRLAKEAAAAGGAFHVLNGNHEFMNVLGDFRYVTPRGFAAFADVDGADPHDARFARLPAQARGRAAAFAPGGPYARVLAERNTLVIVGDSVFVHGGLEPGDARRIDAINRDARAWLRGELAEPSSIVEILTAEHGPVWTRTYASAREPDAAVCASLSESLRTLAASRMVVGHTVQEGGITSACNDRVWRIDVGLARHYGGPLQALEIMDGGVRILTAAKY